MFIKREILNEYVRILLWGCCWKRFKLKALVYLVSTCFSRCITKGKWIKFLLRDFLQLVSKIKNFWLFFLSTRIALSRELWYICRLWCVNLISFICLRYYFVVLINDDWIYQPDARIRSRSIWNFRTQIHIACTLQDVYFGLIVLCCCYSYTLTMIPFTFSIDSFSLGKDLWIHS